MLFFSGSLSKSELSPEALFAKASSGLGEVAIGPSSINRTIDKSQVEAEAFFIPGGGSYASVIHSKRLDPTAEAYFLVSLAVRLNELPPKGVKQNIVEKYQADKFPYPGWSFAVPNLGTCLLYTSPSPRDATLSRMPSSA